MKEILLTHAYYINEDEKEQAIMRPYPPLGILYISAFLKKNHIAAEVFDTTFSDFETHQSVILEKKPLVLAIYTNLVTKINVIKLIKWVRKQPSLTHTRIVLGGPDVTYNIENYLNAGAQFVIFGEGEESLLELTNAIKSEKENYNIPGVAYLDGDTLVQNEARVKIKNMDDLPEPDRKAIHLDQYLAVWKRKHGKSTISISTQRGCPYTCKWCSTAVYGQSYRRRSPALVADEVENIISQYQPDSLWFVDDVFTVSHKWIDGLYAEFRKRNIIIDFECITRAERLSDEILGKLKEMGCSKIWIGAESGSQKIIDEMDRRVDVNLVRDMIIKTKSYGIQTGTFIMLGYPKETFEDIQQTITYLKSCQPDNFTITIAYPIKGTGLYEQVKDQITSRLDWEKSTDRDILFERTHSINYYHYAVKYVVNSVNAHINRSENKPWLKQSIKAKAARIILSLVR